MQFTFPHRRYLKLAAFAVVFALLLPAVAPAKTGKYKGTVAGDENAKVQFKVARKHGKRKVQEKAGWKALDATCDGKVEQIETHFYVTAKVRKSGTFRLDATDSANTVIYLEGKIAGGGTASGTLRLKDEIVFDDGPRQCDSGMKTWSAEVK